MYRVRYAGGEAVLEYSSDHPAVELIVVVPYRNQPRGWSQDEKDVYGRILAAETEVVCLADHYFRGCMPRQNRYMVDRSAVCISYQTKADGGTASTVKYARRKGLEVWNLVEEPQEAGAMGTE